MNHTSENGYVSDLHYGLVHKPVAVKRGDDKSGCQGRCRQRVGQVGEPASLGLQDKPKSEAVQQAKKDGKSVHFASSAGLTWQQWRRDERRFFMRPIFLALNFIKKIASCLSFPENRLTRLFSSTIRIVMGSQYVRQKRSSRFFSDRRFVFDVTSGGR